MYVCKIYFSEHSSKTKIALVGLQVWRGAFLLGDLLIHLGLKNELKDKSVMELGAGTGLTSFVAAMYAKKVICTGMFMYLYAQYKSMEIM